MKLFLTNTLSKRKQALIPIIPGQVSLYVCGVTPYDYTHIGHGRSYVFFDVLFRLLRFLGYHVTYCRNFTDIDDKLLEKAQKLYADRGQYGRLSAQFIDDFHHSLAALNCIAPTVEPCVTDHIPQIISFIQKLIDTGHAYVANGDVYFRISSADHYGKLSGQKTDQLRVGQRVKVNTIKEDPLDFALWKSEPSGSFFKSPWGSGRPGWHIECSALAGTYLGSQIDIHGGGMDLIFPHHENEIAQSEGVSGKKFANVWLHNALLRIDKEKMSKSIGNVLTLAEIFTSYDPMLLRFYFLNHQYRAPLDFSFDELRVMEKSYHRICSVFESVPDMAFTPDEVASDQVAGKMLRFLLDDINTPGMLGVLFEYLNTITDHPVCAQKVKFILREIFGLTLQVSATLDKKITSEIQELLDQREAARKDKDWVRADQLRDQLRQRGFDIKDKKST